MSISQPVLRRGAVALLAAATLGLSSCATDVARLKALETLPTTRTPDTAIAAGGAATNPVAGVTATPPAEAMAPLSLTVDQAIVTALEGNAGLRVQRLAPLIAKTSEDQARAAFDPTLTATGKQSRTRTQSPGSGRGVDDHGMVTGGSDNLSLTGDLSQTLPTGTTVGVGASETVAFRGQDFYSTRIGASVTQALLRGRNVDANLASLRQARLDTLKSEYELRGFAESLVAQTEEAFWDAVLAARQIEIYTQSLTLAQQQYGETQERIKVGKLAETELVTAEAEVATRQVDLINARSALASAKLKLLRLLNAPGGLGRELALTTLPALTDTALDDLQPHLDLAQRLRPELNQTRLLLQRNELELVKTKDGLLPKLDLFITLGKTGYAHSFGGSLRDYDEPNYDAAAGVTYTLPIGMQEAKAQHERAKYTKQQTEESIANLSQSVEVDVRGAYIELDRAREQIKATAASRALQEEKLRAVTEKNRVGTQTPLVVQQAQRDLLTSQIAEVQAVVNFIKGQIELYRLEGSLLVRRGIASPGAQPVGPNAAK